jgi:hypothetical protein
LKSIYRKTSCKRFARSASSYFAPLSAKETLLLREKKEHQAEVMKNIE